MKGGRYLELVGKKIGFVLTGSFCTFKKTIPKIKELVEKEKAEIIPIMSYNSYNLDTKFGKAKDFILEIEKNIGNRKNNRKGNNSHDTRCRTNRSKKNDRYNGSCTLFTEIQCLNLL